MEIALHASTAKNRNGGQKYKFRGKCFNCGRVGHRQAECRSPKNERSDHDDDTVAFAVTNAKCQSWLLDSGASSHMTHCDADLINARQLTKPIHVYVADGRRLSAIVMGDVIGKDGIIITEVLLIPGLDKRLLSIPKLTEKGLDVEFQTDSCTIKKSGRVVITVPRIGGIYQWKTTTEVAMARAMLYHNMVDRRWWAEAVHTAVHVLNRLSSTATSQSPFEWIYGTPSSLDHLRAFGSKGYAHVDKAKRTKLDAKAFQCLFLGYSDTQ
ncbi:TPA: hypothetical protein N0F65_012327 [Lagenidium giganteum]|uniref:CCHC-type domain-containing protein n=1 Tax=Lagenidium giganteum TaxID=4803 RepID=A0AAV2YRL3_9STRA|nr:TPA: hypothetical protein N0F65_012327 [Lagenidium giganteum]